MNKLITIIIICVLIIGGILIIKNDKEDETINYINNSEMQKINLSFKDNHYFPNSIKVKDGLPVELTLDDSIKGCYRSMNIKAFKVSKTSSDPSDKIVFTPDRKGTFEFACSMRMGKGIIIVE